MYVIWCPYITWILYSESGQSWSSMQSHTKEWMRTKARDWRFDWTTVILWVWLCKWGGVVRPTRQTWDERCHKGARCHRGNRALSLSLFSIPLSPHSLFFHRSLYPSPSLCISLSLLFLSPFSVILSISLYTGQIAPHSRRTIDFFFPTFAHPPLQPQHLGGLSSASSRWSGQWRGRAAAVRSWWWETLSVERRHCCTCLPKTATLR